jgi:pyruvate formate lyase activating enzyme
MATEMKGVAGEELRGTVFNIMRFSVQDGPGIRTTVFLKGCPLQCAWCHNPEALAEGPELFLRPDRCIACGDCMNTCPAHAIVREEGRFETLRDLCARCGTCAGACWADARELIGRQMTVDDVMHEVERDAPFYSESGGGVTFSGGEPLLQHRFLVQLLRACSARRFHAVVDTSGYASPDVLFLVAEHTDLFLYDLKTVDDEVHRRFTGVPGSLIRGNLARLASWGKKVVIRMPIIPGINDSPRNIQDAGRFIASLGNIVRIQLLPYHASGVDKYAHLGMQYTLPGVQAPSVRHMNDIAEELLRFHPVVSIGG